MNKLLLLPLLLTALFASPRPASALSIANVVHNTTGFAFDVVWGEVPGLPLSAVSFSDGVAVSAYDIVSVTLPKLLVLVVSYDSELIITSVFDDVDLLFSPSRRLADLTVLAFGGDQIIALDDPYSARFVYGAPYSTPESGPTLTLLGLSLVGMVGAKLRMHRA